MNTDGTVGTPLDRRTLLAGGAAAGAGLLLPRGASAQSARRGGVLRLALESNPASLDPMTGRNAGDFITLYALYDTLIDIDPSSLDLHPGLAKSWRFPTPTTLMLELVQGVRFHDGTPFDAAAVKFNLDRYRTSQRSNVQADVASIKSVEVKGQHQVVIHLMHANSALPTILTDRAGCMVSPKSITAAEGGNVDRTPVGTGPWKFVSWADGDRIEFARNQNYWKPGLPYMDGLSCAIVLDQTTRLRSVVAGENDLAFTLPIRLKPVADKATNVSVQLMRSMSMVGMYINYGKPPFSDVRIRQAMNFGVNRDELNKVYGLGIDEPTSAVIPKEHWACDPATFNYYKHDPDRARKLLAAAGFPNGIDIPVVGSSDQDSVAWNQIVVSQLAAIGMRLTVTPLSPQTSSVRFFGPDKQGAGRLSLIANRADPSQEYDNFFSKTAYFNAGAIELPGFRALLDATTSLTEKAARKAAFAKLQAFVVQNALMMPLLFNTNLGVMNPKVQNATAGLLDKPKFTHVWLKA